LRAVVQRLCWVVRVVVEVTIKGNKALTVREVSKYHRARLLEPYSRELSRGFLSEPTISNHASRSPEADEGEGGVFEIASGEVFHNSRFSSVVDGSSLLIAPRHEPPPWRIFVGGTAARASLIAGQHKESVVLSRPAKSRFVPAFLYVGTRSPGNWYHWIANTLPAIHRANLYFECRDIPLVLPSELRSVPQVIDSLELFRKGRHIVWLGPHESIRANKVFWSTSPVSDSPYSISAWNRTPHIAQHKVLQGFRSMVLEYLGEQSPLLGGAENFFLARRVGYRQCDNQNQLIEICEGLGFETVYCEDLSFRDQVQLFGQAKKVVGPMGAAFANLLFGRECLEATLLSGPIQSFENYFQVLSSSSNVKVRHLIGEHTDVERRSFRLDPDALNVLTINP
jgi:hypothetical protein